MHRQQNIKFSNSKVRTEEHSFYAREFEIRGRAFIHDIFRFFFTP